jgi:TolB-like protein/DNA-binding winged helix-turn-helix (wHTH) protein
MTLDLQREELRDATGARIDLRHRSFAVLRYLAVNAGRVVTKDELLAAIWPSLTVTDDSLTQCISDIRRALGDAGRDLIRTVPRRGYMIVLPEQPVTTMEPAVAASGRNRRLVIPALLGMALLAFWGSFALIQESRRIPTIPQGSASAARGPTVAVLPFENITGDSGLDALADGLTQGMISALGRFGELQVLARGVTSTYKGHVPAATDLGRALNADYVVNGNLRRDGDASRIDIQLSDARKGTQVWSNSFEAATGAVSLLAIQDEIAGKASAMIGSYWGAIGAAEYKRIQSKSSAELTPYECIVQGVISSSIDIVVLEGVAKARDCLDRLTRAEPGNAAAWATLVLAFNAQRNTGFALPPEEATNIHQRLYLADKAVEAANRAVEIAPNDAFVRGLVARAAWMACQPDLVRIESLRAIALNPYDSQNLGPLGNYMAYAGFWDEGVSIADKGIALTAPATPRWWRWAIAKRAWLRGDYQLALDTFRQSYVDQLWLSRLHLAYTLPMLGRTEEARAHVAALLKMRPAFTVREADAYYKTWCFAPPFREKMRQALRTAGLPE